jgi:hypothetical protein
MAVRASNIRDPLPWIDLPRAVNFGAESRRAHCVGFCPTKEDSADWKFSGKK